MEAIEENATLFWESDPDPSPETKNEKRDPAQCPETPPLTGRRNSKTLALPAPALTNDIDFLRHSAKQVAPLDTSQDADSAEHLHVIQTTDVEEELNVEAATMASLHHQSTQ